MVITDIIYNFVLVVAFIYFFMVTIQSIHFFSGVLYNASSFYDDFLYTVVGCVIFYIGPGFTSLKTMISSYFVAALSFSKHILLLVGGLVFLILA